MSIESVMLPNHFILLSSPSPPTFNLSWHQDLFQGVSASHQVAKVLECQLQHCLSNEYSGLIFFRMDWLDLLAVQGTLTSPPTPQFRSINSLALSFLYSPPLTSYMTTGKTIALTRRTFIGKVMSLLFNVRFRLVIAFLPRSKHVLTSWLQSPSVVILEPPNIKSLTVSPFICHEVMGLDTMILVF